MQSGEGARVDASVPSYFDSSCAILANIPSQFCSSTNIANNLLVSHPSPDLKSLSLLPNPPYLP